MSIAFTHGGFTHGARVLVVCGAMVALAGCQEPRTASQGASGVSATYSGRALSSDLPMVARVPAILSAAETALRRRGWSVERRDETEDRGTLIARAPRSSDLEKMRVEARVIGSGAKVTLVCEPFGDEVVSRAVLDEVLRNLGM
ncbi:MAG: hypothetical protein RBS39_01360 [Phycisphaerales bacterium]|nr:hypothetical protein [Phycisphaerales bacterium]